MLVTQESMVLVSLFSPLIPFLCSSILLSVAFLFLLQTLKICDELTRDRPLREWFDLKSLYSFILPIPLLIFWK